VSLYVDYLGQLLVVLSRVKLCPGVTASSDVVASSSPPLPMVSRSTPTYASPGFFAVSSAKTTAPATQPSLSFSASSSSGTAATTAAVALGSSSSAFSAAFSFGTAAGGFKFGSGGALQPSTKQQTDGTNTGEGKTNMNITLSH